MHGDWRLTGGWRWSNLPLPEAHIVLIVSGIALGFLKPFTLGLSSLGASILGAALTFLGLAVMLWATTTAGHVKLADDVQLITGGPYRLSRHPMYVAWAGTYVGLLLLLDSGWLLILIPVLVLWVHWESGREEHRLIESFGAEYEKYQARVRRYL
jgi:protein-S-isoprenylcysteine O-methyltransferase Ste14